MSDSSDASGDSELVIQTFQWRWKWVGQPRKKKDNSYYKKVFRYDPVNKRRSQTFSIGDTVVMEGSDDGGDKVWVGQLLELFDTCDSDAAGSDDHSSMRCTLRWLYGKTDMEPVQVRKAGLPPTERYEKYFSDYVEEEGYNNVDVIDGRAWLFQDNKKRLSFLKTPSDSRYDPRCDEVLLVRAFVGRQGANPVRKLQQGELNYLINNPVSDSSLFYGSGYPNSVDGPLKASSTSKRSSSVAATDSTGSRKRRARKEINCDDEEGKRAASSSNNAATDSTRSRQRSARKITDSDDGYEQGDIAPNLPSSDEEDDDSDFDADDEVETKNSARKGRSRSYNRSERSTIPLNADESNDGSDVDGRPRRPATSRKDHDRERERLRDRSSDRQRERDISVTVRDRLQQRKRILKAKRDRERELEPDKRKKAIVQLDDTRVDGHEMEILRRRQSGDGGRTVNAKTKRRMAKAPLEGLGVTSRRKDRPSSTGKERDWTQPTKSGEKRGSKSSGGNGDSQGEVTLILNDGDDGDDEIAVRQGRNERRRLRKVRNARSDIVDDESDVPLSEMIAKIRSPAGAEEKTVSNSKRRKGAGVMAADVVNEMEVYTVAGRSVEETGCMKRKRNLVEDDVDDDKESNLSTAIEDLGRFFGLMSTDSQNMVLRNAEFIVDDVIRAIGAHVESGGRLGRDVVENIARDMMEKVIQR